MITLTLLVFIIVLIATFVAIFAGLIAISPAILVVVGLFLIDVIAIKAIAKKK